MQVCAALCTGLLALTSSSIHQCQLQRCPQGAQHNLHYPLLCTRPRCRSGGHKKGLQKGSPEGQTSNLGQQFWSPVYMCAWRPVLEAFMHTFCCSCINVMPFLILPTKVYGDSIDSCLERKALDLFVDGIEHNDCSRSLWWLCAFLVGFTLKFLQCNRFFVYVFLMFWM